jgi:hypothetical protein
MWSINDETAADLLETHLELPHWRVSSKKTKSEVFPVLNDVGLEIQLTWSFCQKLAEKPTAADSRQVSDGLRAALQIY